MNLTDPLLSQEARPGSKPLPQPLPNLLESQIEHALLAYRQRTRSLEQGWQNLRALKALENAIDSLLACSIYYGPQTLDRAHRVCEKIPNQNAQAAAFLKTAIEQVCDPKANLSDSIWPALYRKNPRAVLDGLWFYGSASTCEALLDHASPEAKILGVQLTGLLTQQRLLPRIQETDAPEVVKLQAQGLLDACPRTAPSEVLAWLESGQSEMLQAAFSFLLVTGIAAPEASLKTALKAALKSFQNQEAGAFANLDSACALTCIHLTPEVAQEMLPALALPEEIWLRCLAFLGNPQLLLKALRDMDLQSEPLSHDQINLLLVTFGKIPAALREKPGTSQARREELRELAAKTFRCNGCDHISADQLVDWKQELFGGPLRRIKRIRLRAGLPWSSKLNFDLVLEASHRMRGWLYAEQAAVTGRAFPLSADDRASRQLEVLETLGVINELLIP